MCGIFLILSKKNQSRVNLNGNINNSIMNSFIKTKHRGPDNSSLSLIELCSTPYDVIFGFHRLKIMDTSDNGNQPFRYDKDYVMCNGEIYNHEILKNTFSLNVKSDSDCEVLYPLFKTLGIERMLPMLDGVFSFALLSGQKLYLARDPIGIRPLFYGRDKDDNLFICSEAKGLYEHCSKIEPFPPGCFVELNLESTETLNNDLNFKNYYHYTYPISNIPFNLVGEKI